MRFICVFVVGLLFFFNAPSTSAADAVLAPAVKLRLHDYAGVATEQVTRAQEIVVRVYAEIGVTIVWQETLRHGSQNPDGLNDLNREPYACAPEASSDLAVLMLGPQRGEPRRFTEGVLGSTPGTGDEPRRIAYVYHDRARRLMRAIRRDPAEILALVLAHEIGHLLLPYNAHTTSGIMRARWHIDELRRVRLDNLGFTAAQAGDIHRRLEQPAQARAGHTSALAARAPL